MSTGQSDWGKLGMVALPSLICNAEEAAEEEHPSQACWRCNAQGFAHEIGGPRLERKPLGALHVIRSFIHPIPELFCHHSFVWCCHEPHKETRQVSKADRWAPWHAVPLGLILSQH